MGFTELDARESLEYLKIIGRCNDCKWWDFDNEKMLRKDSAIKNDLFGECINPHIEDLAAQEKTDETMAGYDRFFITRPVFGCVLFEKR